MWVTRCRECGELIGPGETDRFGYGENHTECEPSHEEVVASYEAWVESQVDARREGWA